MKKLIVTLLLISYLFGAAFAQDIMPGEIIGPDTRVVTIYDMVPEKIIESIREGEMLAEGTLKAVGRQVPVYALYEALLLLNANRADAMNTLYPTALYVAARNPGLVAVRGVYDFSLCMIASKDKHDLIDTLNRGIESMIADGIIDELLSTHVSSVIEIGEPVAVELPQIEDGLKLRVGVSGDLPPMDYTTASGMPAGFNTAILAEIAKRENLSIELMQIDSGARFAALASGRIDAFFWQTRFGVNEENYAGNLEEYRIAEDETINCLTTIPYLTEPAGWLFKQKYVEERVK